MRALLVVFAFTLASAVAAPSTASRGVTADGRTVVSRYRTSPPWAADIVRAAKPQLSAAERAKKQGGEGFYRVLLDLDTGRVRTLSSESLPATLLWMRALSAHCDSGGSARVSGGSLRFTLHCTPTPKRPNQSMKLTAGSLAINF